MAAKPSRYAATEAQERALLADLGFLGAAQRAYVRNTSIPIQKVRDELHRCFAEDMAALDARIMAGPQPAMPHAPRVAAPRVARVDGVTESAHELAERRQKLDAVFGLGDFSPDARKGVRNDGVVMSFGVGGTSNSGAKPAQLDRVAAYVRGLEGSK